MELMADRDAPDQSTEIANTGTSFATNGADYVNANRLLEA
jgi:hypothetical protein